MAKPKRFKTGPSFMYWPVYEGDQVVALCPHVSIAQAIAEALEKAQPKPKRSKT